MAIQPLADITISPLIASLPKADLHVHQEERARLERVVARRAGRAPYDWRPWAQHLLDEVPPGMNRLADMYTPDATLDLDRISGEDPEFVVAKIVDALEEAAADGAIIVEIRFGTAGMALIRPDFMALFREAERQVQTSYPRLRAEATAFLGVGTEPAQHQLVESQLEAFLPQAREGLTSIDMVVGPYVTEADPSQWEVAYRLAARAVDAGLGVTVHGGEFSAANLAAILRVPGLSRIGHAVYVATDPRLLEQMARQGVTAECCLSCNVVLGAVPSYEAHPIRQLIAAGVPVTLNTDNPVRTWTTIGREYAIAAELGFSPRELLGFTRNAIRAAFTSEQRRKELLEEVKEWEAAHLS